MRQALGLLVAGCVSLGLGAARAETAMQTYPLPRGSGPHDVAPASDGGVWYTAQAAGALGRLDPATGKVEQVALGEGSAPHGVIIGPDGAPWVTDGGLNAIVRVDPATRRVSVFPLPKDRDFSNLNTATFDLRGVLWFTGQNGVYGRLDPKSRAVTVYDAPRGVGPYGMTTTPDGAVFYASLAGSYVGRIDLDTGAARVIEPPTRGQGARRVWADSRGGVWVSEWNAGQIARYDSRTEGWQSWKVPGERPAPYAIYVDEESKIWLSDFGANAIWRFDPTTEKFARFDLKERDANVRQLAGRKGEVWGAESGADRLVVLHFE